jgi:hypothetical protein
MRAWMNWEANPRHPECFKREYIAIKGKHVVTVVVKDKRKCYIVKSR